MPPPTEVTYEYDGKQDAKLKKYLKKFCDDLSKNKDWIHDQDTRKLAQDLLAYGTRALAVHKRFRAFVDTGQKDWNQTSAIRKEAVDTIMQTSISFLVRTNAKNLDDDSPLQKKAAIDTKDFSKVKEPFQELLNEILIEIWH